MNFYRLSGCVTELQCIGSIALQRFSGHMP